jgi:hypothetical protein
MPQIDGLVWVFCGLGLLLSLTATVAIWSATRMAGRDDHHVKRHPPRKWSKGRK